MSANGRSPSSRSRASTPASRFRALEFERCPDCRMDPLSGRGFRACHQPRCPFIPRELDPVCPDCGYDVANDRGTPACAGPGVCAFAAGEGRRRVALLRAWRERHEID
ncbi:MAG: hypothetical protein ACQETV_03735 [Actinomycetota bacterium]